MEDHDDLSRLSHCNQNGGSLVSIQLEFDCVAASYSIELLAF